jgi:uncharacterized membrane protein
MAALLVTAGIAHASGTYYDLGTSRTATGVNGDGTVVAGSQPSGSQPYWMWTLSNPGTTTPIGGIGPSVDGAARVSSDGTKISGTFAVAAGTYVPLGLPSNVVNTMAVYDVPSTTWTPVGGLGWFSSTTTSAGLMISGNGHVLVGLGYSPNQTNSYAITSTDAGPCVALPWNVPGRNTRPNAVNSDGSVIVGWHDNAIGTRQGAVWINGAIQRLWKLYPTNPLTEATAVSGDGAWVFGLGTVNVGNTDAYRWSVATGWQSLGASPAGFRGNPTGANADGSIVVGTHRPLSFGATIGFVWTTDGGMQDLTTWVQAQGVTLPAGVTLTTPNAISADGRTIVGVASDNHGFVVRIDPPARRRR